MSGILDLLNRDLGKIIISGVSNQTNQPQIKTQDVLYGFARFNVSYETKCLNPSRAEGLINALRQ
jgi:hypothetical protein